MWPFKKKPAPVIPPTPPAPSKSGTVVLTLAEVSKLLPAIVPFTTGSLPTKGIAQIYDTLLNSVITPPAPWPPAPCRFDHLVVLPGDNGRPIAQFIFYPL